MDFKPLRRGREEAVPVQLFEASRRQRTQHRVDEALASSCRRLEAL